MIKVTTIKKVSGYLDEAINDFENKHKVIQFVNRRTTKYGYDKIEVIWDDEKEND